MKSRDTQLLEEAYSRILNEFLGFGKKEDAPTVGTKFANILAKALMQRGFKKKDFQEGTKFEKQNRVGARLIFTFGGGEDKYKETPVSILLKFDKPSEMFKDLYKTFEFPTIDLRVDPQDLQAVKKKHEEKEQHEERQKQKFNQIYNIIGAFESEDLSKLKELLA